MRKRKLTDEQIDEIRKARTENNTSFSALAKKYDVSPNTILRICNPEKYRNQLTSNKIYQEQNKEKIKDNKKNNYTRYEILLHNINDSQIISMLNTQKNVTEYIKSLIKKDIE